jgi:hypothetical protein
MTIFYDADDVLYSVVEYLASSKHIYNPVKHLPRQDGQYRVVCFATRSEDAWKVAHLLCSVSNGSQTCNVCLADEVGARRDGAGTLPEEPSK